MKWDSYKSINKKAVKITISTADKASFIRSILLKQIEGTNDIKNKQYYPSRFKI